MSATSSAATLPLVVPVPHGKKDDFYEAVKAVRRKEIRREMRFFLTLSGLLVLTTGYAGFVTWRNDQVVQVAAANANRVIYVTLRDDGTLTNSVMYTSLPPKWTSDNRLNTLWDYVFWRECYSESEAPKQYYNVQRMSDERVAEEWRHHMSLNNPQSPRNTHGKKRKYYTCDPINYFPIGSEDNRFGFRFKRYEHDERGRRDDGIVMEATVAFRTNIWPNDADAWIDKAVFNAPGVQVWEYPGARPDALQPHLMMSPGMGNTPTQPASSPFGGRAR